MNLAVCPANFELCGYCFLPDCFCFVDIFHMEVDVGFVCSNMTAGSVSEALGQKKNMRQFVF